MRIAAKDPLTYNSAVTKALRFVVVFFQVCLMIIYLVILVRCWGRL